MTPARALCFDHLLAATRRLEAARVELAAAKAAVAEVPPPPYGSRDVRYDRLAEAHEAVEDQTRNVETCSYYLSVVHPN